MLNKAIILAAILVATASARTPENYQSPVMDDWRADSAMAIILRDDNGSHDEGSATILAQIVLDAADRHGVSYALMLAIIGVESRFDFNVRRSWAGARGLCQVIPATFISVARSENLGYSMRDIDDPIKNVEVGTIYTKRLDTRYGGSIPLIAAGYNGGPGVGDRYRKKMDGQQVHIPRETLNYVAKVTRKYDEYSRILGK